MMGFVVTEFQERVSWGEGKRAQHRMGSQSWGPSALQQPGVQFPGCTAAGAALPRSVWSRRPGLKSRSAQAGSEKADG